MSQKEKEGQGGSGSPRAESECERRAAEALPKIDFATFILSLSSSVLIHLGEMSDPETGATQISLPLAKQTLDILGLLQDKTRGNLTDDEDRLLTELLYDLRMKFVKACKSGASPEGS